ncbi:2-oxo acid dehydrogenase subunit E2 [Virgisporangium aurantiacum]|uniref:2-oxoacid dehydrogenase acyltransferase catalytic domain-containing protein n=1 Tax=Virgisporangium aurantiacum TaxID=175570 RepID=A0A8J3ZM44_9ACTN|nr:2-oxo acid dehydrogenase subunit E2 [Virgisporangium aurantiacum]GIJ64041.1 hypothetical protein Vau01_115570 [Virgisporangium aurantiacum]
MSAVATATADLIARARTGRLRQEELEGGTLTVTNHRPVDRAIAAQRPAASLALLEKPVTILA